MRKATAIVASLGLLALAAAAVAQPTLQTVDNFYILSLSADGSAAAGQLTGNFEPARWSSDMPDTAIALGRSIFDTIGNTAGKVDISADGTRIGASVASDDTMMTWGLWTKGVGWTLAMPPSPPGGIISDRAYGSCWGLSGDGLTVAGMYWTTGSRGQAGTWTETGGIVTLASPSESRPNGINHDGTVVGGWSYAAGATERLPTIWEDGAITVLADVQGEVYDLSADGSVAVGHVYDPATGIPTAALWTKTGDTWTPQLLGYLPGTQAGYGMSRAEGISDDGSIVVGFNKFSGFSSAGIIWTPDTGLMRADTYVTNELGLSLPDGYVITWMTAVSRDGHILAGYGNNPYDPYQPYKAFIIDRGALSAVPDAAAAGPLAFRASYPNPFNPVTNLELAVARTDRVRVEVFDARGRRVRLLHDGELAAGTHVLTWDGRDDAGRAQGSGVYLARATGSQGVVATRNLTLVK